MTSGDSSDCRYRWRFRWNFASLSFVRCPRYCVDGVVAALREGTNRNTRDRIAARLSSAVQYSLRPCLWSRPGDAHLMVGVFTRLYRYYAPPGMLEDTMTLVFSVGRRHTGHVLHAGAKLCRSNGAWDLIRYACVCLAGVISGEWPSFAPACTGFVLTSCGSKWILVSGQNPS